MYSVDLKKAVQHLNSTLRYSVDLKTVVQQGNFCSLVTSRYDTFDANKVRGLPHMMSEGKLPNWTLVGIGGANVKY